MEEKRLDELLNEGIDIEEMKKTEKTINKKMNEKILTKSFIVSLIVVLITGCSIVGVQKYRDYVQEKNAFHLSDWEMVVEVPDLLEIGGERLQAMNAYAYINAYITLFCPGYISTKTQVKPTEPVNVTYGSYQIEAELIDLFKLSASQGNISNVPFDQTMVPISWSNVWLEDSSDKYDLIETKYQSYRFNGYSLGTNSVPEEAIQEMKEQVKMFPVTSVVMLDITFNDALSLDDVLTYQQEHKDSRIVYVSTHTDLETNRHPYGFNLFEGISLIQVNDEYAEIYPMLTLRSDGYWAMTDKDSFWHNLPEYDAKTLIDHYLSCMKLLVNNGAAKYYEEDLVTIIEDVEKNGVSVKGFRIFATKDDALTLFEDENVKSIVLQDVKLSKYQK